MPKREELGEFSLDVDPVGNIFEVFPCIFAHKAVVVTATGIIIEIINEGKPEGVFDGELAQRYVNKMGPAGHAVTNLEPNERYTNVFGSPGFHTHNFESNQEKVKRRARIFGI